MCIVIDINAIPSVFDRESNDHSEFAPIYNWIINGKGKVVFGGTRFNYELSKLTKYLRLFNLLKDAAKGVSIDSERVDLKETEVRNLLSKFSDCNDHHIVALLSVSGCKLIASKDAKAYPFFQHRLVFNEKDSRPKIYSNKSNKSLLCYNNIALCCTPAKKTTNSQRKVLNL